MNIIKKHNGVIIFELIPTAFKFWRRTFLNVIFTSIKIKVSLQNVDFIMMSWLEFSRIQ